MKNENLLLLGGGTVALFLLMQNNGSQATASTTTQAGVTAPVQLVGINSGQLGGNGSYYTCSNYAALLAADPNLGNPNYIMTPAQVNQYMANYADIREAMPSWVGHKYGNGAPAPNPPQNVQQAAQTHWWMGGCAQKRIFYPLTPTSPALEVPPPANGSGSSGSWVGTALQVAGTVAAFLGNPDNLNDGEIQCLFTGGAVLTDILPFYKMNNNAAVTTAQNRLTNLLLMYV